MAIRKIDKYADYRYEIVTEDELREARWLIEQGDFRDMEDYIECTTRAEIRRMKYENAEKKKRAESRKKRITTGEKRRAA